MQVEFVLKQFISKALQALYGLNIAENDIKVENTNPEFEGDLTLVVFPYLRASKKKPEETAQQIGEYLKANCAEVGAFNVVKGFLNISIADSYWLSIFKGIASQNKYGIAEVTPNSKTVMVEYSSPNTNKPLHLGHIRNNLLGYSVAEIVKATGTNVIKANLVNDRGVHICKSMLAWKNWGNGETPQSSGLKGDHLVGKYYVVFDKQYKAQLADLKSKGLSDEEAEKKAPLMLEVQEMLRKWEAGDKETIDLWKTMNGWVYEGFEKSYKALGVNFDKMYYESNTYLLGKQVVEEGLQKKVFQKRADGSVFIDLTADGLDEKTLLRADGTSVYMTQDLGTAIERFKEFPQLSKLIYTVGNEQDYHFKVLFLVLKKLGYVWADECYHLSYGMVELPEGKMKSREGTVVDADDLIQEMINTARTTTEELGKLDDFSEDEKSELFRIIGLAALKYFILKVDPKKKMLFNPKESIDFNGNTGPFIQYTYARIRSILRKAEVNDTKLSSMVNDSVTMLPKERSLVKFIYAFPSVVQEAAKMYSPAIVANYVYDLAKEYNQFYHDCPILKEDNVSIKNFRLALSVKASEVIKEATRLLGIEVPERM